MARALALAIFLIFMAGCRGCGGGVRRLEPAIGVDPISLDFGKVKTTVPAELPLVIRAETQIDLLISSVVLEGDPALTLEDVPASVGPLGEHTVKVKFAPPALRAYSGTIVITSNDEGHPETRIPVTGEGASPTLRVEPRCDGDAGCAATVALMPPAVTFAPEAFERRLPASIPTLPLLALHNDGPVDLIVEAITLEGADAAAFELAQPPMLPLTLAPMGRRDVPLRFKPLSETQTSYRAEVVIASDDVARRDVRVPLSGALRPNLPPEVCANVVRVVPSDGSPPVDYSSAMHWAPLLVPPMGGYDFSMTRDLQPRSDVTLSALSSGDQTSCTADPEDGRLGLTWQWRFVSQPAGTTPPALSTAVPGQARFQPLATGTYVVELLVADVQGHSTTTTLALEVALKKDLVVQLSWSGYAGVDLDLHLVRPSSSPFSFFDEGDAGRTAGDINGYSALWQQNMPGFDFDWGETGAFDDPRLNLDDIGTGQLIENVSLNYPENDAPCGAGPCTYRVMVHSFNDRRPPSMTSCTVGPACRDGERCDCAAGNACVALDAPKADAGEGPGRCLPPPKPTVRIFLRGAAAPSAVIPLDTLMPPDDLSVPAPCQLLHVADVQWPQKSTMGAPAVTVVGQGDAGYVTAPSLSRYGWRQRANLQCAPNVMRGGLDWYGVAP